MMSEKEFVFPLTQVSRTKNDASSAHSSGLNQKTVEALRGFLHEMTATIQSLTNRHNLVCQGYNNHVLQDADMRSSFSKGVSLMSNDIPAAIGVSPAQSDYRDGVQAVSQSLHWNGSHVPRPHYQAANLVRREELTSRQIDQAKTTAVVSRGTCIGALQHENGCQKVHEAKTRNMVTGIINFEGRTRKGPSEPICNKPALDAKTVDALRCFLEEMKKTVQLWSIRHRLLDQGHGELAGENADMPESMHFELASTCCMEPSRVGGRYCPLQSQEVETAMDTNQAINGQACALASNQPEVQQGSIEPPQCVQSQYCEYETPESARLVSEGISECSLDCNRGKGEALNDVGQCPRDGHLEQAIFHDRVGDCSSVPCEHGQELNTFSPANHSKIMPQILASADVVKVVESPDWLPYGWTTEVKTRQRGNSAGTTDKYYYDPISKRRFRSRKEVVCFLATGKAGRYKPKRKVKCNEGASDKDCNPLALPTSAYQFFTGHFSPMQSGMPVLFLPHMPSTMYGTLPFGPASGFFSNLFVPFLPGQHSDGLVHDTFFNVPHHMYESFQSFQQDAIKDKGCQFPNEQFSEGPTNPLFPGNGANNADEGRPQHSLQGFHMCEIGQNSFSGDDGHSNPTGFPDGSRGQQIAQPLDHGTKFSDGTSNFMLNTLGKSPHNFKKLEARSIDRNGRSPQRTGHGFGLNLLAIKLKKTKPQEKQALEALGRRICQQGLSFLQGCKNLNVQTALKAVAG